jgi:hypothetical protein
VVASGPASAGSGGAPSGAGAGGANAGRGSSASSSAGAAPAALISSAPPGEPARAESSAAPPGSPSSAFGCDGSAEEGRSSGRGFKHPTNSNNAARAPCRGAPSALPASSFSRTIGASVPLARQGATRVPSSHRLPGQRRPPRPNTKGRHPAGFQRRQELRHRENRRSDQGPALPAARAGCQAPRARDLP